MAKRWVQDEDEFLLCHHGMGADFIAFHDLGRPPNTKAGTRRLQHLTKTGARSAYARMMLANIDFQVRAGHASSDNVEHEKKYWLEELANSGAKETT